MTSQQQAELQFWRNTFNSMPSAEAYVERRRNDLADYSHFLPEIHVESGSGLDLACGLVSIFEGGIFDVTAVDALLEEYDKIYRHFEDVKYHAANGEDLSLFFGGTFDWVWCCNAIDHTPHPERMIAEIRRVLKPGGRLYFWVNFDRPPLCDAHYEMFTQQRVDELLKDFHLERGTVCWSHTWKKYIYAGLYVLESK